MMLLTIKTLQQATFKVEIDDNETVKHLKEKIEHEKGMAFPVDGQKLIYSGKVMEDEKTLKDYKVTEAGFVVVMSVPAKKPAATTVIPGASLNQATTTPSSSPAVATPQNKPVEAVATTVAATAAAATPAAATPAAATAASAAGGGGEAVKPPVVPSGTNLATAAPSPATGTSQSAVDGNDLVTGADYERSVQEIMCMGFERDQVIRAMAAGYNNPNRAVEYLLSGNVPDIPTGVMNPPEPRPTTAPNPNSPAGGTQRPGNPVTASSNLNTIPTAASEGEAGGDPLAYISQLPQFQQMRTLVRRNPSILPELLNQIGRTNPQLLQIISANQQRFLEYLNQEGGGPDPADVEGTGGMGLLGEESLGGDDAPLPPGATTVRLTPQEREAVDRLKQLGFPELMVVQAYFACDKNEDAAANFLLSEQFDDEEMGG